MPIRRLLTLLCVAAATLAVPTAAVAAQHQTSGTVVSLDWSSLTIQTSGRGMGVLNAMTAAANRITKADYSYVYGGGHAQAGIASIGINGPGYNGRRAGFDCSGSVAAVLAGAGVWTAGSGVPADNGIISQLRSEHLIAPGVGQGAQEVTLWDKPGVHIFMNIDGRFFGTSDGGGGNRSQKHGGAGWLDDGAPDTLSPAFHPYHLLASVLGGRTTYGPTLTLTGAPGSTVLQGLAVGNRVRVAYTENNRSVFIARAITYLGAQTIKGILTAVAADGSSFQLTAGTRTLTLSTAGNGGLLSGAQAGDSVRVTYTRASQTLTAHAVTVLAAPTMLQTTGTVGSIASDGSALALSTADGHVLKLTTGGNQSLVDGLVPGDTIAVTYSGNPGGTLVLQRLQILSVLPSAAPGSSGSGQVVGAITWIDGRHGAVTIQAGDGDDMTFSVAADPGMLDGLHVGEFVQVSYTENADGSLAAAHIAGY
jgi:uncharacterized protein DUF5666